MAGNYSRKTFYSLCTSWVLIWILLISAVVAYSCVEQCTFDSQKTLTASEDENERCLISMPDNPVKNETHTFPCQMEIQTNCTEFCHVHLYFKQFNLHTCEQNLTDYEFFTCEQIDNCEYVVLSEIGVDERGAEVIQYTRFNGDLTSESYRSRTDHVLLQFCYRSETFSARNLQIEFKALDPVSVAVKDYGPPSVYVLLSFVVVFIIAIFLIRYSPWLKPCLDPVPPKEFPGGMDL